MSAPSHHLVSIACGSRLKPRLIDGITDNLHVDKACGADTERGFAHLAKDEPLKCVLN